MCVCMCVCVCVCVCMCVCVCVCVGVHVCGACGGDDHLRCMFGSSVEVEVACVCVLF